MNIITKYFILGFLLIIIAWTCKDSTQPQPADCDLGYHPCDYEDTFCCPDTTSHNFVWEIDTLGIYGSIINDVAIVDENDIWVVGALSVEDSTMQYPGEKNYNGAHWNGNSWNFLKIWNPHAELKSIEYFSENDIWVLGSYPIHWDGTEWTLYHLTDMGVTPGGLSGKIWAISPENIYFVGGNGRIVHYDGIDFLKMESNTIVTLKDIHGTPDGEHVFIAGYDNIGDSIALELINGHWVTIYSGDSYYIEDPNSIWGRISSVHTYLDTAYFTTTNGLLKYNYIDYTFQFDGQDQSMFYDYHFIGTEMNNYNDILLFSRTFSTLHFNGSNWLSDESISDVQSTWTRGCDFKDNLAVITGYCCGFGHAIVARGSRQ